jgi:preprotein translocase subunit SecA
VIENAQKKVEARNFDIRKHLLEYDNTMNSQRQAFYARRREAMDQDPHAEILDMSEGAIVALLDTHWPERGGVEPEAIADFAKALTAQFGVPFDPNAEPFAIEGEQATDRQALGAAVLDRVSAILEGKKKECDRLSDQYAAEGYPNFSECERQILLQILDAQWKDHLHSMDSLRAGINMRAYGQKDPKLEYQREGFGLFEEMNARIDAQALELVFKFALPPPPDAPRPLPSPLRSAPPPEASPPGARPNARPGAAAGKVAKVGRNDPCPCGSGKKYKKCHGAT